MMKKRLLLPVTLLAAFSLLAQPTLQNNVLPSTGDVIIRYQADPGHLEPGQAGANQVWDFTHLKPVAGTSAMRYEFVPPADAPHSALFPTANLVCKTDGAQPTYAYYSKENTQWALLGEGRSKYWVEYGEPAVALQTPLRFNGRWQGDYTCTTKTEDGRMVYSVGARSATYDAFGTLKTPSETFSHAMRVRYESTQTDSTVRSNGTVMINHGKTIIYNWFVANRPDVIVSIYYTYMLSETRAPGLKTVVTEQPFVKSANYISSVTTSAPDAAAAPVGITLTTLGPNPATDELRLRFSAETGGQSLQVLITDAAGKEIESRIIRTVAGENTLAWPVARLTAGNYFLTLADGRGVLTRGWVKQ